LRHALRRTVRLLHLLTNFRIQFSLTVTVWELTLSINLGFEIDDFDSPSYSRLGEDDTRFFYVPELLRTHDFVASRKSFSERLK
jgi:hypothetical protein